mmetsp:Transcript_77392/g.170991  ORF Transcript_77392/g.170991 Transcript_77392/m.170991 type:complete len:82 (+) Transcript_77392:467-712(+)
MDSLPQLVPLRTRGQRRQNVSHAFSCTQLLDVLKDPSVLSATSRTDSACAKQSAKGLIACWSDMSNMLTMDDFSRSASQNV